MINRRTFIRGTAATIATLPFSGVLASGVGEVTNKKYPIAFFTKPLDHFELPFMAETLAMAGIDGFDLAVRPKGRVEPNRVSDDLHKAIETGKSFGLNTEMMVSGITGHNDEHAEEVLKAAASVGIKHYRLGYYSYDFSKGIVESLAGIREKLESLVQLNRKIGIQAGYQNHAGTRMGAPMWDVWESIKNLPKEYISCQFDIRHAVTEGSSSWILALHLLGKNIGSLAIKDFTWDVSGGRARVVNVPLGEGIVDFDLFFITIKELNIIAPMTLHIEYPFLSKEEENLPLSQRQRIIVSKIKQDVDFIRANLNKQKLI
jgi:L-ribulose-5-phosphate 3-epimerase